MSVRCWKKAGFAATLPRTLIDLNSSMSAYGLMSSTERVFHLGIRKGKREAVASAVPAHSEATEKGSSFGPIDILQEEADTHIGCL
jgi:hypothetical protein